jgi:two-component system chemotaxis response regulator CheB
VVTLPLSRPRPLALGIGASAGGPPALAAILQAMPGSYPLPVLVAQHLGDGFTAGFQKMLAGVSALPVTVATGGAPCLPGRVYLAPEGRDLCVVVGQGGLRLHTPPASGLHRPSADALFSSLADALGPRAAGLLLSGMGDDGAAGLLKLLRAGGRTLAQDESSAAVFGMPKAARDAGAAEEFVPLHLLAARLVELT